MKPQFLLILFVGISFCVNAQRYDLNKSVLLSATVHEDSPLIELSWNNDDHSQFYEIYRRQSRTQDWGAPIAKLKGTASGYLDTDVVVGTEYEYRIRKRSRKKNGQGYILSGIKKTGCASYGKGVGSG